jgi:signal transduction histidine kinase
MQVTSSLLDISALMGAGIGLMILCFAISRVLRALKHGFSIRLQLFFALFFISLSSTAIIGFWAIYRIEARAVQLLEQSGLSTEVLQEFIKDFGLKTSLILGLITLISAGTAWALGRGIAQPIERLAKAAEDISLGSDLQAVPEPSGKEVRYLTDAFIAMHQALEDRQRFENFITDLSHDLKNPVAAIQASSEVLLAGAAEHKHTRMPFLQRIDEASLRLNRLLSDFLGLARLEARGIKIEEQAISLPTLTQTVIESFASLIETKKIQIELKYYQIKCLNHEASLSIHLTEESEYLTSMSRAMTHLDAHKNCLVLGHSIWLRRMLDNLLSNAIRYTPPQGQIRITFLQEMLDQANEQESGKANLKQRLMMWIEDNGDGVDSSLRHHLFERFMTDYHNPKGKTGGSGLGLAIVKRVVDAHQGKIILLDQEQKYSFYKQLCKTHENYAKDYILGGACFQLEFPLHKV